MTMLGSNSYRVQEFPQAGPYRERIADDLVFNPSVHLALEFPENTMTLPELGYSQTPSGVPENALAATSCFRVLSAEGVAALYHVCKQLEQFTTSNPRIARNVRGGVYRSAFLRDLALSADVTAHMSELLGTPLAPHGMPHQLAHLNFQPLTPGENVDKWHWDTLQVDYVMFVTDPNAVEGGEFQYFHGTKEELVMLREQGHPVPPERIIAPSMPGPGYAVLMQGEQVVHQARGIKEGERITLVNGYTYLDVSARDYSALGQLVYADPESTVLAEYTRHMALRCQARLSDAILSPNFATDKQTHSDYLRRARQELDDAILQLESLEAEEMRHLGD